MALASELVYKPSYINSIRSYILAMNIGRSFRQLSFKRLDKCNPKPGYGDSCEPCRNCGKKRLSFEEEDNRCCYMPAPNFGSITEPGNYVLTPTLNFDDIECSVDFECKFETNDGWDDGNQTVKLWTTNTGFVALTRNDWFSFAMSPGDEIYFEFTNNVAGGKCITIHLKNITCNINYGTVGQLCTDN